MSWLRRLFGQHPEPEAGPAPESPESSDLSEGRRRLRGHLSTADRAIRAAMTEADNTFGYQGPDRRQHPR